MQTITFYTNTTGLKYFNHEGGYYYNVWLEKKCAGDYEIKVPVDDIEKLTFDGSDNSYWLMQKTQDIG